MTWNIKTYLKQTGRLGSKRGVRISTHTIHLIYRLPVASIYSDKLDKKETKCKWWIIGMSIAFIVAIASIVLAIYFATKEDSGSGNAKRQKDSTKGVLSSQANPGPGFNINFNE